MGFRDTKCVRDHRIGVRKNSLSKSSSTEARSNLTSCALWDSLPHDTELTCLMGNQVVYFAWLISCGPRQVSTHNATGLIVVFNYRVAVCVLCRVSCFVVCHVCHVCHVCALGACVCALRQLNYNCITQHGLFSRTDKAAMERSLQVRDRDRERYPPPLRHPSPTTALFSPPSSHRHPRTQTSQVDHLSSQLRSDLPCGPECMGLGPLPLWRTVRIMHKEWNELIN